MATSRPRRAIDAATPGPALGRWRRVGQVLVDGALWTLGGLGLISLLATVAAHVWGFSIVLFSTGSMAPTIPAGSAALVRLLPATELRVGDVTTVERKNLLPITHRITSVKTLDGQSGQSGQRVITMRGDANELEDPEPYVISDARLVVASLPGVASFFSGLRSPLLMGVLTILAGLLVSWAFWPRQTKQATVVAAVALVAGSQLLAAPEAQAAQTEHQIVGRHVVLTVISDNEAMGAMRPGTPVFWQVGVATRAEEEGQLHIGLSLGPDTVDAGAMTVEVKACTERWQDSMCAGVSQDWVSATTLDRAFLPATHNGSRELGTTPAGTPIWVLVRATLNRQAPQVRATMKVDAWGGGEVVSAESDGGGSGGTRGGLAHTGSDGTVETLALAGVAVVSGLLIARLAGRRRRDTDREVAR